MSDPLSDEYSSTSQSCCLRAQTHVLMWQIHVTPLVSTWQQYRQYRHGNHDWWLAFRESSCSTEACGPREMKEAEWVYRGLRNLQHAYHIERVGDCVISNCGYRGKPYVIGQACGVVSASPLFHSTVTALYCTSDTHSNSWVMIWVPSADIAFRWKPTVVYRNRYKRLGFQVATTKIGAYGFQILATWAKTSNIDYFEQVPSRLDSGPQVPPSIYRCSSVRWNVWVRSDFKRN